MTGDEPVWTPAAAAAGAGAVDDFAALAQFTVYAGGPDRRGSGR
jgi:hypothetical protein